MIKHKNTNKNKYILAISILFIIFIVGSNVVYATDDEIYKPIYTLAEYNLNSTGSIGVDIIRWCLWKLIQLCSSLIDGFYSALGEIFKLMTFNSSTELFSLSQKYKVLYKPILIVTIVGIGLWLIISNKSSNQLNISTSLMLMLVIVLGMPVITEKLTDITKASSEFAMAQWNDGDTKQKPMESVSSSIINNQIVDLNVLDESMTDDGSMPRLSAYGSSGNNFKPGSDDWKYLSITQGMGDSTNDELKHPKVWENTVGLKVQGLLYEKGPQKLDRGLIINEYYYRFQIRNWLLLFIEMIASLLILGMSIVRLVMILIEISIAQIYMPFIAITDLATGQRMKEALKGFIALFASIFLIYAILGVYFAGIVFLNGLNISIYLKCLVICGWAMSLIKGSDIVERITGVDLGFKNSNWALAGTYFGAKTMAKSSKMAFHGIKNIMNKFKPVNSKNLMSNVNNPANSQEMHNTNNQDVINNKNPDVNNSNNKNNNNNNQSPQNNINASEPQQNNNQRNNDSNSDNKINKTEPNNTKMKNTQSQINNKELNKDNNIKNKPLNNHHHVRNIKQPPIEKITR